MRSVTSLWRAGDFGIVVLGSRASEPITLDGSGVALWEALATPSSVGAIVASLAAQFGTEPARVSADVVPLLEQLLDLGVVEPAA